MIARTLPALALAALALLPAAPRAQTPPGTPPPARTLRVSGDARVVVRPDVAVLQAGVEATGPELARVTRDAAAQQRRILAALAEAGVADRDVQTTRHDVRVERAWKDGKPGPISGYTVVEEVRVTVRDLSRLGGALERITAAGANALHGLAFEKEDPGPEQARALSAAYAAARAKAEALARAAGAALGEVLSLSETGGGAPSPRPVLMAMRAGAEGAPVSPGEVEVSAAVEVVYALR